VKRLLLAALVAAGLAGSAGAADVSPDPRWGEAVGDLRILVIRATWGPVPTGSGDFSGAAAFYSRASFGKLKLRIEITPWLQAYDTPACITDSSVSGRAQAAATAAGYDVASYARLVYVVPERVCNFGGLGIGREVFLAPDGGVLDDVALVHELGHTFGLPHAASPRSEYGDPLSPMGTGTLDFSALEKLKLGWISSVQRVDRSGTYGVADIDEPSSSPQALVVPTARGEYWVEHRRGSDRFIARIVRPNDPAHPVYLKTVYIGQAHGRYVAPKVFSVTRDFGFRWLDRTRPTAPRAHGLDNSYVSWRPASDAGSGVAQYRVTLDGKLIATTFELGAALPPLAHGGHRVAVVAVDRAGNRSRPGIINLNV
jgi:hypothetical protein